MKLDTIIHLRLAKVTIPGEGDGFGDVGVPASAGPFDVNGPCVDRRAAADELQFGVGVVLRRRTLERHRSPQVTVQVHFLRRRRLALGAQGFQHKVAGNRVGKGDGRPVLVLLAVVFLLIGGL